MDENQLSKIKESLGGFNFMNQYTNVLDTRADTHLSRWSVQTFPAPPVEQAALLTPRAGPSGTPGPAACWTSCMTTTLENPSFRLTEIREQIIEQ